MSKKSIIPFIIAGPLTSASDNLRTDEKVHSMPIPDAGTVVKPAGETPTAEWLLGEFNFDLEGVEILE